MALRSKFLWALFALIMFSTVPSSLPGLQPFGWVLGTSTLTVLLVAHTASALGAIAGPVFLLYAGCVGLAAELLGLRYEWVFGGRYTYAPQPAVLYGVPWAVVIYWAVFTYAAYCLVTSFRFWAGLAKPRQLDQRVGGGLGLLLTVMCDGCAVTLVDVLLDPIAVRAGYWTWLTATGFYGVPFGNFLGWFCVSCLITGPLRVIEWRWPRATPGLAPSDYLIPVLGYGALGTSLFGQARALGLEALATICGSAMIALCLLNLALFARWRSSATRDGRLRLRCAAPSACDGSVPPLRGS